MIDTLLQNVVNSAQELITKNKLSQNFKHEQSTALFVIGTLHAKEKRTSAFQVAQFLIHSENHKHIGCQLSIS